MCLTSAAFGMFLGLIGPHNLTVESQKVTIHTPQREFYWLQIGDNWCTAAPGQDHMV